MDKKGQIDFPIIAFAVMVMALILLAPIALRIVGDVIDPFSSAINDSSTEAGAATAKVLGTFVSFWDIVIMFAFLVAILLLFISSVFIDTNPFFIVLYILILFLVILFAPTVLETINAVYDSGQYTAQIANLPMTDFVRMNFGIILAAVGILTMIIIYAKVRYFPASNGY